MTRRSPDGPAVDALGGPVPTPDGVDAYRWSLFCRQVVMLPGSGCHLWTGVPRGDGYGQFWAARTDLPGPAADAPMLPGFGDEPADPAKPRTWRAHRFAYTALTGEWLHRTDQLLHACDQPLCVPITAEALPAHITPGDNATNAADRDHKGRLVTPGHAGSLAWPRRGPATPGDRSAAIHTALEKALTDKAKRSDLPAIVAKADAAVRQLSQPTLF